MPEAIVEHRNTGNYAMVRAKQLALCNNYISDMNKHTGTKTQAIRNEAAYNTLPSQLAKENKKFQYALIKSGARATEYEHNRRFWVIMTQNLRFVCFASYRYIKYQKLRFIRTRT